MAMKVPTAELENTLANYLRGSSVVVLIFITCIVDSRSRFYVTNFAMSKTSTKTVELNLSYWLISLL